MCSQILFVGRQPDQYAALWRQLDNRKTSISFAASQARAVRALAEDQVDVVVLDASTLPGPENRLCRSMRRKAPSARLVLITATPEVSSLCYDFHLVQPVTWRALLEMVDQALDSQRRQVLAVGAFILDLESQTVLGPAGESRLTPKLFSLLKLFMSNAGKPVARLTIMQEVWNTSYLDDTRTLDVHMVWLRQAIEPNPKAPVHLVTRRGVGYVFLPDSPDTEVTVEEGQDPEPPAT